MRRLADRLRDVIEAIEKIEQQRVKGQDAFESDAMLQVWMVHHLMIIGEPVRSIDPDIRRKHPEIPWRDITGMRDVPVHDYFRINTKFVWKTVTEDLEALKKKVLELLSTISESQESSETPN